MKTKKTSIEKFAEKTNQWAAKLLNEKQGYVLLCYNELDDDKIQTSLSSKGNISSTVECLHVCMNKNPMFANIVVAAANAMVQARMMQEEMQKTITENVDLGDGNNQN